MRVLISGSREIVNVEQARELIHQRIAQLPDDTIVVHGGARGVDTWAEAFAWAHKLETEKWDPDWEIYGKKAGLIRNIAMLNSKPDLLIAFWNGVSSGTLHAITKARQRGIPVEVIPLEPPVEAAVPFADADATN